MRRIIRISHSHSIGTPWITHGMRSNAGSAHHSAVCRGGADGQSLQSLLFNLRQSLSFLPLVCQMSRLRQLIITVNDYVRDRPRVPFRVPKDLSARRDLSVVNEINFGSLQSRQMRPWPRPPEILENEIAALPEDLKWLMQWINSTETSPGDLPETDRILESVNVALPHSPPRFEGDPPLLEPTVVPK
jgi:hypothetical protein